MALYNLLLTLVFPTGLCWVLLVAAVLFRKRDTASKVLFGLGLAVLMIFGNSWFAGALSRSLEWKHLGPDSLPRVDAIVCLGGGTLAADPPRHTVEVGEAGDRFLYAAHLFKEGKAPYLIGTGGIVPGNSATHPGSRDIAALWRMIGVPPEAIVEQEKSRNTYEDATYSYTILKERKARRILLVTSAMHMPRSLAVFRKQCPDLEIIPAPTDFSVVRGPSPTLWEIVRGCVPNSGALQHSDFALHEYIGLAYYRLRGWI